MVEILNEKKQTQEPTVLYLNIDQSLISPGRKKFILKKLKSCGEDKLITGTIGKALITKYSDDYSKYLKTKTNKEVEDGEMLLYDVEFV